jgi:peptidoglycan/xylan/chitin deacetylase (PgdA/CDA1 family)
LVRQILKIFRTLLVLLAVAGLLVVGGCALLPCFLQEVNPSIVYRVPDSGRTLFLTLDDGPSSATPQILAILRKHRVQATFFVTTDHIDREMMGQILADGHQLANHLKVTTSLDRLSDEQFQRDFQVADHALSEFPHVMLFRPPGGSMSKEQAAYASAQGYGIVVGTVFPLDHWLENKTAVELLAKSLTIEGGIVILHDTASRGPRTAVLLDELIPWWEQKGYKFGLLPPPFPPKADKP